MTTQDPAPDQTLPEDLTEEEIDNTPGLTPQERRQKKAELAARKEQREAQRTEDKAERVENRRASTLSEAYLNPDPELTPEEREEKREARKAEQGDNRRASTLSEEYLRSQENE